MSALKHTPEDKPEVESVAVNEQSGTPTPEQVEELDADEAEFRAIRQDLPGVKGAGGAGIVAISVGKVPTKNEFFRTHPDWRPIVPVVDHEVGIEKQFFAVDADMVANLAAIGITVTNHVLYLTVTARGGVRSVGHYRPRFSTSIRYSAI
jgi:hypothetical protein